MDDSPNTANALVLQCGGPTAVFNASLAGVLSNARARQCFKNIYGARLGFRGLLEHDWADLTSFNDFSALELQPGSALGSGRMLLADSAIPDVLERLTRNSISAVFIIGGNGSMAAANKLHHAASAASMPLCVIGIPKTIDNDIAQTAVCPGFASAAQFVIQSARDVALDLHSMRDFDDVAVLEVMGRDTGWLAAASTLARWNEASPPHIILLPEAPVDEDALLRAIADQHLRTGYTMVVTAEGARSPDGVLYAEKMSTTTQDQSGQKLVALSGGAAPYIASLINGRLKRRCRQIRPDTIQRSASQLSSELDSDLAFMCGEQAINAFANGDNATMTTLNYSGEEWECTAIPLSDVVAGKARAMPPEFISSDGVITPAFAAYLESLELQTPGKPPVLF